MTTAFPFQPGEEIRDALLYRRIPPNEESRWVAEEKRPTKYNFMPAPDHEHLSMQLALDPATILTAFPGYGLLEIEATKIWDEGCRVTYKPDEGQDHVAVWGLKNAPNSKRDRLRKRITRAWEPGTQQLVYEREKRTPLTG